MAHPLATPGAGSASPHMPPEPKFCNKWNYRGGIAQFETEFNGLMTEPFHGQPAPRPAAESGENQKEIFRDATGEADGAPFIEGEKEERGRVKGGEPAKGKGVRYFQ